MCKNIFGKQNKSSDFTFEWLFTLNPIDLFAFFILETALFSYFIGLWPD